MNDDELIVKYLEPNPDKGGKAEYRLKKHGLSVWAVIGRYQYVSDAARVAEDCEISEEAVSAALAFYRRNKPVIDDRIAANEWI